MERMRVRLSLSFLVSVISIAVSLPAAAADWPQFLGPTRDGVYTGDDLAETWPAAGPKKLWAVPAGEGYSGAAIAGGEVFFFDRRADQEVLECLAAETGKPLWKFAYDTDYQDAFGFDNGPRATPTVTENRVVIFGAGGWLHCLDRQTGQKIWGINTTAAFQVSPGFFGAGSSPLVLADRVLLNVGGAKAGIVALDLATGRTLWSATADPASYASPIMTTIDRTPHAVFFTRTGFVDLDPATGQVRQQFRWRARINASVNAATPLAVGNEIFLSTCYDTGAICFRLEPAKIAELWKNDASLSNHFSTSVVREGTLYGLHGRQEEGPQLRAVDWKTGEVLWSEDGFGTGSLILAGDRILLMQENGELVLFRASPTKFESLAKASLLAPTVRAHAALADGRLYVRNGTEFASFDVRKP